MNAALIPRLCLDEYACHKVLSAPEKLIRQGGPECVGNRQIVLITLQFNHAYPQIAIAIDIKTGIVTIDSMVEITTVSTA